MMNGTRNTRTKTLLLPFLPKDLFEMNKTKLPAVVRNKMEKVTNCGYRLTKCIRRNKAGEIL
jgi:hypothetical protein